MYQVENGLSEAAFKECADRGKKILVLCVKDAYPERGNFRGGWKIFAFNPETRRWAPLNLFRTHQGRHPPRIIRTINGLCRLLKDLEFPAGAVPYGQGAGIETNKSGDMFFFSTVDIN